MWGQSGGNSRVPRARLSPVQGRRRRKPSETRQGGGEGEVRSDDNGPVGGRRGGRSRHLLAVATGTIECPYPMSGWGTPCDPMNALCASRFAMMDWSRWHRVNLLRSGEEEAGDFP